MIRITDQYFWNFIFGIFFLILVILGSIILETEARMTFGDLTFLDIALLTLATWRLTLIFGTDTATKWFREQFYDLKKVGKGYSFELPKVGPRRVFLDALVNPIRSSVWIGALLTFCYLLSDVLFYPLLFLSIAALVIIVQAIVERFGGREE